jgi:hypothetical protein
MDVVAGAAVSLVGQPEEPGGGQLADDAPDTGGAAITCRFMPWRWCLPE